MWLFKQHEKLNSSDVLATWQPLKNLPVAYGCHTRGRLLQGCHLRTSSRGCVSWPFRTPWHWSSESPLTSKFSLQVAKPSKLPPGWHTRLKAGVWRCWTSAYLEYLGILNGATTVPCEYQTHEGGFRMTRAFLQARFTTTEARKASLPPGVRESPGWTLGGFEFWILALWPGPHNISWVSCRILILNMGTVIRITAGGCKAEEQGHQHTTSTR